MNDLLSGAFNLTIFGMGFVFTFLTILVFITKFMSFVLNRNENKKSSAENSSNDNTLMNQDDINEEEKFIIEQAIKMHTGA
jgi:oxaloacetate decarboxylase gamma subunit